MDDLTRRMCAGPGNKYYQPHFRPGCFYHYGYRHAVPGSITTRDFGRSMFGYIRKLT